jgi:F-type H+-transporting ATPase subunit a
MLITFIVIIEAISNLIRPGKLAVRLTANMIAGHLLLTLLGNNGPSIRHTLLTLLITAQIFLLILEAAVGVIQSYVLAILRTLYSREVNKCQYTKIIHPI